MTKHGNFFYIFLIQTDQFSASLRIYIDHNVTERTFNRRSLSESSEGNFYELNDEKQNTKIKCLWEKPEVRSV